jgi:hypothetical protein
MPHSDTDPPSAGARPKTPLRRSQRLRGQLSKTAASLYRPSNPRQNRSIRSRPFSMLAMLVA